LDATSKERKISTMPAMSSWEGPENWVISFPLESETLRLSRKKDEVFLNNGRAMPLAHLTLSRPVEVEEKTGEIQVAEDRTRRDFPVPRFRDSIEYRYKATYLVIFLLFLQETFFALYKRFTYNRYLLLRGVSVAAWVVMGIWLVVRVPLI
jgi:hypothetical protein